MSFHDGSCEYTEGAFEEKNGKKIRKKFIFADEHETNDYDFRHAGIQIRVKEVRALIDEIYQPGFVEKNLKAKGFN